MGVDFYAYREEDARHNASIENLDYDEWEKVKKDEVAYIRESYHGYTHAISVFAPESYEHEKSEFGGYVYIPAAILRYRLPAVKKACLQRAKDAKGYGCVEGDEEASIKKYAEEHYALFENVVKLAEEAEAEGKRILFYNSW